MDLEAIYDALDKIEWIERRARDIYLFSTFSF